MTAPARPVYDGATQVEIHAIYEDYIRVLTAPGGPLPAHLREKVADVLGGFGDAWRNQIDDPEPADTRDVSTVAEIRRDAGLCPDGGDHFHGSGCAPHECPTWRESLAAETERTGHYR